MAVDEALLASHVVGHSPPVLRLYGWKPAAVSLGRSQEAARSHASDFLRQEGIDLVRRPTGGLAVLHEHERTYSVVTGFDTPPFSRSLRENYRQISGALRRALELLGIETSVPEGAPRSHPGAASPLSGPVCFERTSAHEIIAGGQKLVGSAQLRRRDAFLQHGSVLCRCDARRLAAALGQRREPVGFVDLERLLGNLPSSEELDRALAQGFEHQFGVRLEPARLSSEERDRAVRLYAWKYLSAAWTYGGRLGERELRWESPSATR
jgi:lipoate-protein ligase A